MPALDRATRGTSKVGAILTALILVAMLLPGAALAANTITPVTGGGAISADTATTPPGTAAWTALGGPVVTEGSPADIPATGTVTLGLVAGSFEFRTAALGGAVGAAFTASAGTCSLTVTTPVVTATTIVTTLSGTASTGSDRCRLTFSGIQVRPTNGVAPNTGGLAFSGAVTGAAGTLTMVPGAPILSFQVAPSPTAIVAGANFTMSPTIRSQDRFGNLRTGDSITLATVPAATGPSCTANPVTTVAGDAAFLLCHINTAGSFLLRASGAGASVDYGTTITVSPGTATKLVFTTQPARGTPGGSFAVQPIVTIQDSNDNVVTTASALVTLAIGANPGGGGTNLLCSPNPLATTNGVASFSSCRINNVGVGYTLTAHDGSALTDPTSSLFDVADRLVFANQPSTSVTAGVAFSTQPIVHVRAGASNTATHDSTTSVTLSLKSGTGATGAALTCDSGLSRTVVAGVATFAGCKIDKVSPVSPARPYVIVASASNLSSAESTTVAVIPGAAAKLGFTAQPASATSSQTFAIQPVVAVQDLGGNTVTSGTNSNATVTLAIGTNPAGGTLTCTSGLTRPAVDGVATFFGCQINNAGVGYTLTAAATGLTGATSTAFTVSAPTAQITLTTSSSVITWGRGIVLTTQFGVNGGTKNFQLQGTRDNVTWTTIATLTTNSAGWYSFAYRPVTNLFYRAVFAGTPDLQAANSPTVRTVVRQIALMRPTNGGAVRSIARNTSITFTTTVRPARPELAPAKVSFFFYRLSGGSYVLKAKRDVLIDGAGLARTTFKFTSSGRWFVTSAANPTPYNANSYPTPRVRYSVR